MRAAAYARKSTEQSGDGVARSVNRQVGGARKFIEERGWDHAGDYVDDGASGALFSSRPEFQRMLADAEAGRFDHLVLYDLDRFGRHAQKTMAALARLADAGVTVWDFSKGAPVDIESFEGETLTFLQARFAQQYREQIRKHTRDAFRAKALAGFITGNRIYGYDNVGPSGQKRREPNPEEAPVVREIWKRYAGGEGLRGIAHDLNDRGVAAPRKRGWSPSTVRSVLVNETYTGTAVYGRSRKAYGREIPKELREKKEKAQLPVADESSWITYQVPALVDKRTATRVAARFAERRQAEKKQRSARNVRYLLSGILVCPCGASFEAIKSGSWNSPNRTVYMCSARRRKGPSACAHGITLDLEKTDAIVLEAIASFTFEAELVNRILSEALSNQEPPELVRRERDRLSKEIANLVKAVAQGGDIPELVSALSEKRRQLASVEAKLQAEPPDRKKLRLAIEQKCREWRDVLRSNVVAARGLIKWILEPLRVEVPDHLEKYRGDSRGLWWTSFIKPDALARALGLHTSVASPTGIEPVFSP